MTDMQVSLNAGEIIGAVVSIAASYIAWSAKRVLSNFEQSIDKLFKSIEQHKEHLDRHDRCLLAVCIHHRHNHGEEIDCE